MALYEVWKSRRSNERLFVITKPVPEAGYRFCLVHKDNRIGPVLSFMSAKDLSFFYEKTHDAHVDQLIVGAVLSLSENSDSDICPTLHPNTI